MDNIIFTSNLKTYSSLNCDEGDKENPQGAGQTTSREEKTEITKPIIDKELEKAISRGWESPNAKNATTTEIELAKMHWGFVTAMDNYFFVSRDAEQFIQTLQNTGFSYDWYSHERQVAIARLAIKKKLRMLGESQNWNASQIQPILNTLIAAYRSGVGQQ
jgi:hypothetical protein